jgi:hypothetical protein
MVFAPVSCKIPKEFNWGFREIWPCKKRLRCGHFFANPQARELNYGNRESFQISEELQAAANAPGKCPFRGIANADCSFSAAAIGVGLAGKAGLRITLLSAA